MHLRNCRLAKFWFLFWLDQYLVFCNGLLSFPCSLAFPWNHNRAHWEHTLTTALVLPNKFISRFSNKVPKWSLILKRSHNFECSFYLTSWISSLLLSSLAARTFHFILATVITSILLWHYICLSGWWDSSCPWVEMVIRVIFSKSQD